MIPSMVCASCLQQLFLGLKVCPYSFKYIVSRHPLHPKFKKIVSYFFTVYLFILFCFCFSVILHFKRFVKDHVLDDSLPYTNCNIILIPLFSLQDLYISSFSWISITCRLQYAGPGAFGNRIGADYGFCSPTVPDVLACYKQCHLSSLHSFTGGL